MKSKGQAWAEYVIILAVALIFAGIAVFLAGNFLGGNSKITEHDSASYWFSADVGITRYYINSSASWFLIKNNKNFKINVTSITSRGTGTLLAPGGASSVLLDPGQSVQVTVTGLNCSGGTYYMLLLVNYTDLTYGARYSLYGEKPLVGTCVGSSALQCSSNSQCGTTPCQANACYNATYIYNYTAIGSCNNSCSGSSCASCSCTATPSSCGTNSSITCPHPSAYCNGNSLCPADVITACNIPCSGTPGSCKSCTPTCTTQACTACPANQVCSGGSCSYPTCTGSGFVCTGGTSGGQTCECGSGTCCHCPECAVPDICGIPSNCRIRCSC